jgi:RNA polymerase sigma-70 factor (ECF subfamily)
LDFIQSLSEQQRMLINLRDVEGYDYAEIAEISGLSINTIRVNISRARQSIRNKILKQEENEELRSGTIA